MRERNEPLSDRDDDAVSQFVRVGLERAVSEESERLSAIEAHVRETLSGQRRAGRRVSKRSWTRPVWAFGAAAALFVLGFFAGSWWTHPASAQGVEFAIYDPTASQVSLAISYPVDGHSEWEPISLSSQNGLWHISLKLPPGTYEYGFKIDGRWWANDPAADYLVMSPGNSLNAVRQVKGSGDQS